MRRFMFLIPVLLASCMTTPEDTTALMLATEKLDAAKTAMADVTSARAKTFRDELLKRALGEIEQARLDELHSLAVKTKVVTIAADGTKTETLEPGTLDPVKVDAINAEAKRRTDEAIKVVLAAYESTQNLQAQRDFDDLYDNLRLYWMTRLTTDQQKQALAESVKDLLGIKEGK